MWDLIKSNTHKIYIYIFLFAYHHSKSQIPAPIDLSNKNDRSITEYLSAVDRLIDVDPDSALKCYFQVVAESADIDFKFGKAVAFCGIGQCYMNKGNYEQSLLFMNKAIKEAVEAKNTKLLSYLYLNLASLNSIQGQYGLATLYNCQSLNILERFEINAPFRKAQLYNNMGRIWANIGEKQQALISYNTAEQLACQIDDSLLLSYIYLNKGQLYYLSESFKEAATYSAKALHLAKLKAIVPIERDAMINLGCIHLDIGNYKMGFDFINAAAKMADLTNTVKADANTNYHLGYAFFKLKKYNIAEYHLRLALEQSNSANLQELKIYIHTTLAALFAAEKQYKSAYLQEQALLVLKDSIEKKNTVGMFLKYQLSEKDHSIAQKELLLKRRNSELKNKDYLILSIAFGCGAFIVVLLTLYKSNVRKRSLQAQQLANIEQQQRLNNLTARIDGIEQERNRLARELHDGIGGMLSALIMNFNIIHSKSGVAADSIHFSETLQLLNDTASQVRKTAHDLMPVPLQMKSLQDALKEYCGKIQGDRSNMIVEFNSYGMEKCHLNDELKRTIYFIVQELLQNIIKHACAGYALVQLTYVNGLLHILVEDNGIGIANIQALTGCGIGLKNVKEQVELTGGTMNIVSESESGTSVYIEYEPDQKH